jgi:hypothetical protein
VSSDIESILDEISGKMAALSGVVAYAWDKGNITTTPAVLVGLPDRVGYRTTYSRKGKSLAITLVVLVGKSNERAAHKNLLPFLENSGERSVFRVIDSAFTTYTTCDDVTVLDGEPGIWVSAGTQYLGAEFTINVTATGA